MPPYGPNERNYSTAFDDFCAILRRVGVCTSADDCCQDAWHRPMLQHAGGRTEPARGSCGSGQPCRQMWRRSRTLPFVDQSLNSLLVYKWHQALGIRPLWAPSLYIDSWALDLDLFSGSFGRNDANVFKHMNFVLDELHNQRASGHRRLWLVDLARELAAENQQLQLSWDEKRVTLQAWRRSLCLGDTTTAIAAQLFVVVHGTVLPWSGLFKAPAAWDRTLYQRAKGAEFSLRFSVSPSSEARFLSVLSLGTWRLASLPVDTEEVLVDVVIFNGSPSAWTDISVCAAGGNATLTLKSRCASDGELLSETCRVPRGGVVRVVFTVVPKLATSLVEARWALCVPGQAPFGVLFVAKLTS